MEEGWKIPVARSPEGDIDPTVASGPWAGSMAPLFQSAPLPDPNGQPPRYRHTVYHLGSFLFSDSAFPPHRFVRSSLWRNRFDHTDHLLIRVFTAGRNQVLNGARGFVEEQGRVCAVNLGDDVAALSSAAEVVQLILPQTWLAAHAPHLRDARGDLLPPGSPAAQAFADWILAVRVRLASAGHGDLAGLQADVAAAVRALVPVAEPVATGGGYHAVTHNALLAAMVRFIDANLAEETLGVDLLLQRFAMSRATLYRLFKPLGGVGRYILRRRLEIAFAALMSAEQAAYGIGTIALDHGFVSASHFSRVFREHFGVTPSAVRDAPPAVALPGPLPGAGFGPDGRQDTEADRICAWIRAL